MRLPLALLASLALPAAAARADVIPVDVYLTGAPAAYTPGQAFSLDLRLGATPDLGLYSFDVVFRTTGPADAALTIAPLTPSATGYVLPSADFFGGVANAQGADYRVTLFDFVLFPPGVAVVSGVNDRIATLTVTPLAGASGPIQVFVDRNTSVVATGTDDPIPFGTTPSFVIPQAPPGPAPVPAPPGAVLAVIGVCGVLARRLVRRAGPTDAPSAAVGRAGRG